jgi:hypothetical protein
MTISRRMSMPERRIASCISKILRGAKAVRGAEASRTRGLRHEALQCGLPVRQLISLPDCWHSRPRFWYHRFRANVCRQTLLSGRRIVAEMGREWEDSQVRTADNTALDRSGDRPCRYCAGLIDAQHEAQRTCGEQTFRASVAARRTRHHSQLADNSRLPGHAATRSRSSPSGSGTKPAKRAGIAHRTPSIAAISTQPRSAELATPLSWSAQRHRRAARTCRTQLPMANDRATAVSWLRDGGRRWMLATRANRSGTGKGP